jgi:GNAT superfamily N-acetyltransferase
MARPIDRAAIGSFESENLKSQIGFLIGICTSRWGRRGSGSKRPWTNERWNEYASDPNLRTFAAYYDNALAGYYELRRSDSPLNAWYHDEREGEVEIAYFGLLPDFIRRGLGGALLTSAIEKAWAWAPTPARVWVHTCNRDHPNALNNYRARGFKIYKIEKGEPADH